MKKSDQKNIIIIFATLITSILSLGIFNLFFQLIFIIIFIIICCLGFSYINNKSTLKRGLLILASTIEVMILCISIINKGSLISFYDRIKNFFVAPQEASTENTISFDVDFESYFDALSEQIDEINNKVENTDSNIENLNSNLSMITNNWDNIYFNENRNEKEINEIISLIEENHTENSENFANLRDDLYSIELLYKVFISEKPYYYCNVLEALNKYGINTDKLEITENILFVWDIEELYVLYNMKISNANDLESDVIIPEKKIYYNYNRAKSFRYDDTFDYGEWYKIFTECTSKDIDNMLNNSIMDLYKKFIINFSTE